VTFCQFHQRSASSLYGCRAQKRKRDSQVISLFTLLQSAGAKVAPIHVGEIDPSVKL